MPTNLVMTNYNSPWLYYFFERVATTHSLNYPQFHKGQQARPAAGLSAECRRTLALSKKINGQRRESRHFHFPPAHSPVIERERENICCCLLSRGRIFYSIPKVRSKRIWRKHTDWAGCYRTAGDIRGSFFTTLRKYYSEAGRLHTITKREKRKNHVSVHPNKNFFLLFFSSFPI